MSSLSTAGFILGKNWDKVAKNSTSCFNEKANWKQGEDVIIVPAVFDGVATERFPKGWKAPKPHIRIVQQPQ